MRLGTSICTKADVYLGVVGRMHIMALSVGIFVCSILRRFSLRRILDASFVP
ncbi:hypothetical protein K449DRAFT_389828 [Hypoxylon sp. EC38]|nr:hypothetical protein K449DRAFT_389828 [Hypoxylon sp. EC38]